MRKKVTKILLILFTLQILLTGLFAQTEQKAELVVQTGLISSVYDVSYSSDGKIMGVASGNQFKLIDIESGKELKTIDADHRYLLNPTISPGGKMVATGWNDVRLWDVATGKKIKSISQGINDPYFNFNRDETLLAIDREFLEIWSIETGKLLFGLKTRGKIVDFVFSEDNQNIITLDDQNEVVFWDQRTGQKTGKSFVVSKAEESSVEKIKQVFAFDRTGKYLAFGRENQPIIVWDIDTEKEVRVFEESLGDLQTFGFESEIAFQFSIDSENLITLSGNKLLSWNISTGKKEELFDLESKKDLVILGINPDGNNIAFEQISDDNELNSEESELVIWDVNKNKEKFTLARNSKPLSEFIFSHDEKLLVTANGDISSGGFQSITLWNIENRVETYLLNDMEATVITMAFSPDDKLFASVLRSYSQTDVNEQIWKVAVWDIATKKKVFETKIEISHLIFFSPDSESLIVVPEKESEKKLKSWSIETGREINITPQTFDWLKQHKLENIEKDRFNKKLKNGHITSARWNRQAVELLRDEVVVAKLIPIFNGEWAVVTPNGLFDASQGARGSIHYVLGFEPVVLEQMKELYYVPGLLQKIFNGEPLPKVDLFTKKDLFPEVEFSQSKPGQKDLIIKLKNRGGGIGQVQVVINGKEFVADARPVGFDSKIQETTLTVSLKDAPFITGQQNKIEVVARNSAGSLSNRGTARGVETFLADDDSTTRETPNIYAIIGGVSDYTGNNLDLSFAAKDAEDFAKAIEIGATKLLGDNTKVHIRLLTSNGTNSNAKFDVPDAKISTATKADFRRAFADFSKATPNDVFIVYLAGHGVSLNLNQDRGQAGGDTYLYLTQEATTTDKSVLAVKQTREAMSVSSDELKDLMKQNKALKQVLILDTCAAGALSQSLIGKRDLPSDQIRAIERLKDNTGFYVLMGSAANSVSYEASQYGQGLLTYSLLQGMKGAKLRENQFADINLLFGYAQETVPQMAKNIGGIQRPLIITPDTSASFDIGKFTASEQAKITLSNPKPIILRPNLQNKEQDYDDLELTKDLQAKLRDANFVTVRGGESTLVFIDADEMVDAVKPSGSYIVKGDEITVTLRLIRNKEPINTLTIKGKLSDREELLKSLVTKITEAAKP